MCRNEVIDRYMHCIMQNFKKNDLCLDLLESICKPVQFFLNSAQYSAYINQ